MYTLSFNLRGGGTMINIKEGINKFYIGDIEENPKADDNICEVWRR